MSTVVELIAQLEKLPGDMPVLLQVWNGYQYNLMSDLAVGTESAFNLNEDGYDEAPVEAWRTPERHLGDEDSWDADDAEESWEEAMALRNTREVVILSSEVVDENANSEWEF